MNEVLIIIIYLLLSSGGLIAIKSGSNAVNIALKSGTFNFSISLISILGLICYIGSFLLFTFSIVKKFNLTYIMPIVTGINQIIVIIAGILIFKEKISTFGIVGIFLVITGIIFLNIK